MQQVNKYKFLKRVIDIFTGVVNSVVKAPEVRTAGFGIIPGLTPEESALLAAILAALLTLLLLLIPILCCLTPLFAACGGRKKKAHRHANMARWVVHVVSLA